MQGILAPLLKAGNALLWGFASLAGIAVIAGIVWFIVLHTRKYYLRVIIQSMRSGEKEGTMKTIVTRGGIFNRKNYEVFKIRGRKQTYPIPPLGYIYPDNTIYFRETEMDNLIPIRFPSLNPDPKIQTADQDMKRWNASEIEDWERKLKKENWWDRYGNTIILGSIMGFAVLVIILSTKFLGSMADKIAAASQTLAHTCQPAPPAPTPPAPPTPAPY